MERNTRIPVASSDIALIPSIQAPSIVQAPAERTAAALSRFFGAAGDAFEAQQDRMKKKAVLKGTNDAMSGLEPDPKARQQDSYLLAYQHVKTQSALADLSREAAATYENSPNKDDPAALNQELDQLYAKHFGGLDPEVDADQHIIRQASEGWSHITSHINDVMAADAKQRVKDDVSSAASNVIDTEYSAAKSIDFQAMNDRVLPLLGAQDTNDLIASRTIDLAIRNGDPSLIDKMPRAWHSGAPTPAAIPRYADALRNGRQAADNQRVHNANVAAAQLKADRKSLSDSNEAGVVASILNGRQMDSTIRDLVSRGDLEPEKARALVEFGRSYSNNQEAGDVDVRTSSALEIGLRTGTLSQSDIVDAANAGALGSGKAAMTEMSRLFGIASSTKDAKLTTAEAKGFREELKERTKPTQSPLSPDFNGTAARDQSVIQATALRHYDESVLKGVAPSKAMQDAISTLPAESKVKQLTTDDIAAMHARGEITESQATDMLRGIR